MPLNMLIDFLMSCKNNKKKRLLQLGIPLDQLSPTPSCLVEIIKDNESSIPNLVYSILPTDEDGAEIRKLSKRESGGGSRSAKLKELYAESLSWVQWMMFGCDPLDCLKDMTLKAAGQRGVCGAVWGQNDLAYRCRTCEHDPTCAICVPCFQNGNHKDHDYSIMYTGRGCCDCGDETAWKHEGFCSKHKGIQQIQPLSEELVSSVGPVIDILLACWRDKVVSAEHWKRARDNGHNDIRKVANELSSAVVNMLLDFCNCSESLLSFISSRIFECSGLLDVLVRGERYLDKEVVKKLHEFLLKLLGEPLFKYEFAKVLIQYYPATVNEIIEECSDSILEKYTLLPTFSVQIFTVPTLTQRLVKEVDLLGVLLGCLTDLFLSCVGEDGRLQLYYALVCGTRKGVEYDTLIGTRQWGTRVNKWANIYETTLRVVEDTRYIMSHNEVPMYISQERPDISRASLRLLSLVEGMDPHKRATGIHTEEDNDNVQAPFALCYYLGNVHSLLVGGAFSVAESNDIKGNNNTKCGAKGGKLPQASFECGMSGGNDASDSGLQCDDAILNRGRCPTVPSSATWLILECLKTIESLLESESACRSTLFSLDASSSSSSNYLTLRKKLFRTGTSNRRFSRTFTYRVGANGNQVSALHEGFAASPLPGEREELDQHNDPMDVSDIHDMFPEYSSKCAMLDDSHREMNSGTELGAFKMLNSVDWPDTEYDVSSQEISFHIPLHRLLSLLLRKALKICYEGTGILDKVNGKFALASSREHKFFGQILNSAHPSGFAAYIMENPLRLRVLCAQVRAGMWRKNGDAAILSCEWYRSVQWLEIGLEQDLFLLQCCAALAPPDFFVKRIQERFGLTNYTSLNLADYNKYESVLVQEMLTLIIQIVKERRFCGLLDVENLQRELVYKLAIGDATHSQLLKALPRDLSKSDQLRNILDTLAIYSKPSGMKQGKYSLRKAFWKELDLYHPRWNSRDLQVAEERYLRFCKVSALNAQLPRWTKIFEPLNTISRIATSKSVLQIIRAVIFYAIFTERSSSSRASDGVLITTLHLLSLALDICEVHLSCDQSSLMDMSCGEHDLFLVLTYASEEFDMGATDEVVWKNQSLLSLLVALMRKLNVGNGYNHVETKQCNIASLIESLLKKFAQLNPTCLDILNRLAPDIICNTPHHSVNTAVNTSTSSDAEDWKAKARERQAAIMEKMKAEQSKFIASLNSEPNLEKDITKHDQKMPVSEYDHAPEESAPICSFCRGSDSESPLCFLILLQKPRLTSFVKKAPISWDNVEQLDKETCPMSKKGVFDSSGDYSRIPAQLVRSEGLDVAYGIEPSGNHAFQDLIGEWLPEPRDIQTPNASDNISRSSLLTLEMLENEAYYSVIGETFGTQYHSNALNGALNDPQQSKSADSYVLVENIASLSRKISKSYQSSIFDHPANAEDSSTPVTRFSGFGPRNCDGIHISSCGHAVHLECHDRYLASLKQRHLRRLGFEGGHIVDPDLGELLCPVCRRFANSILPAFSCSVLNRAWDQRMPPSGIPKDNLHLPLALSLIRSTAKIVGHASFQKVLCGKQNTFVKPALEPALRKLCILYSSHSFDNLSASGRLVQSLILWDTLMYSLVSTEIAARGKPKTYPAGSLSLKDLYGELQSSSGFILSLLLHVGQATRISSLHDVLVRFRGIQLLAGSICFGVSGDSDKKRGNLSSVLEHAAKGGGSPDVLFFKRAADPILVHDPFSSLMWTLFCLPSQFLSSIELFAPLVHLFYCVCVVQALITCYSTHYVDVSCFGDCVLNDICKMMGESEYVRKYFVSSYIDDSCHPKDIIRRFTFPYLRRCALLWKLLQSSSTSAPLYESSSIWQSNPCAKGSAVDSAISTELNAIKEFEDMFQIQSLELFLKNEVMHSLALKWCDHLCEELNVRNCRTALFSTPAVPFKLIQLPRLYQDLLQRYVKQQCSSCKSVPNEPALCLLCGRLCSSNWKSCCRASRCLSHATICGGGIGVFLLIRRTTVFLQRSLRESSWSSPYLDAFGEEDRDMHRGRPLYLNEERYAALTYLVACHGLDRTSEVLRQTTINLNGTE